MSLVKVLYIGGAGRSGSTLLERYLNASPDCVCVGEVRWIWQRGVRQNQLCGCGSPFHDCPFWNQVFVKAFGGMDTPAVGGMLGAQSRLDRFRCIPALAFKPLRSRELRTRLETHTEALTNLYGAVSAISGRDVVVDNSKGATYAYLLAAVPALEVKLMHLVRDSRGVAYSWSRKRRRPEVHDDVQYMPRFRPQRAAFIWLRANFLMTWLRRRISSAAFLRYEDYTQDWTVVERACAGLGISLDSNVAAEENVQGGVAAWHTVSGNPIRFSRSAPNVRIDEEWREEMSTVGFVIVTALTAPALIRYGYRLGRTGGLRRSR